MFASVGLVRCAVTTEACLEAQIYSPSSRSLVHNAPNTQCLYLSLLNVHMSTACLFSLWAFCRLPHLLALLADKKKIVGWGCREGCCWQKPKFNPSLLKGNGCMWYIFHHFFQQVRYSFWHSYKLNTFKTKRDLP